jgi:adenylate cyclase
VLRALRRSAAGEPVSGDERVILDAVDQLLVPGAHRYTRAELADRVGMDAEHVQRFWRAMGFPDPAEGEAIFTDTDAHVLSVLTRFLEDEMVDVEVALQITRVVGQAMSRVADAQVEAIRERLEAMGAIDHRTDEQISVAVVARSAQLLPSIEALLVYQWRRHLAAAAQRVVTARGTDGEAGLSLTVGFADMVGFTALSQQLEERELAAVVGRFETLAYDAVATHGGRIVKMIGDEVMFVTDEPAPAVEIGLNLAEAYTDDETVSDVRIGLAHGPVLAREGDYFGPTVNLASRIVNIAYVGAVVVASEIRDRLGDDDRFVLKAVRPRRLKGIGITPLWVVRRPDQVPRRLPEGVVERMRVRRGP